MGASSKSSDKAMDKLAKEANLIASKERSGLIANEVKASLFNDLGSKANPTSE